MRLAVVIPWRPTSPARERACEFVRAHYTKYLPNAPIVLPDSGHEPFNLAACRNMGVCQVVELGAQVVVISDADTIIRPERHLHRAIDQAAVDGLLHMPFVNQLYLDEQRTDDLLTGRHVSLRGGHQGNGGVYVITPAAYWRAGGQDERFSGWGGDDDAFVAACTALLGPVRRHNGVALSAWHPAVRDIGSDRHKPNAELARRYCDAIDHPDAMRALIAERPAPCTAP